VTRLTAAACAAAIALLGAAPAAGTGNFSVTRALGSATVRQDDPAADLIGTQLRVAAGLDRQTPAQNGLAALVAQAILQTPVDSGTSLEDAVSARGGSISYDVGPHDVRFYLEGLPDTYPTMLGFFSAALARPDFSAAALSRARKELDARIAQLQSFPLAVGLEMLNRTFYTNSDAGMPPLGLPQTLAGFSGSDAQAFYGAYYVRGDSVLSTAGKLGGAAPGGFDALLAALRPGSSSPAKVVLQQLTSTSQQLIARRDIPVPWLIAQYKAPDLRSRDFGAMLVLASFLERTLADVAGVPTLASAPASQRGVGATYNFETSPASVVVYVDGGGNPAQVFTTALTIVNVLGHAKLQGDLSDMKTFAIGRFLERSATLRERALLAGTFVSQRLDPDYTAQTIAAINRTTASDLQRVAVKYLGLPNIALVLPRDTQQNASP
jgi:predicted Zn-dependent peptidase